MPKPSEGLQDHCLWTMDGRTWIERVSPQMRSETFYAHAIQKGWATLIPREKVEALIGEVRK